MTPMQMPEDPIEAETNAEAEAEAIEAMQEVAESDGTLAPMPPTRAKGPSLRKQAMHGTAWTIGSYGVTQVLRLGSNIIVSHMLAPGAYGLMALISVVTIGLGMFSDIGIRPAIIHSKRGNDPDLLNTAWTIQMIRGFALWIIASALAPFLAWFYAQPQLLHLIPVASFVTVINGFTPTSGVVLERGMQFKKTSTIQLIAAFVGAVSTVTWAYFDRSVWALVAGWLITNLVSCLLYHPIIGGPSNRFRWDRSAAKELLAMGRWIFISTAVAFIATYVDRAMLGKLVPIEVMGVYNMAVTLAFMPGELISRLTLSVLLPALAHHARSNPQTLAEKVLLARRVIMSVTLFVLLGLIVIAPPFFRILYDARYADAAWMTQLTVLAVWFVMLQGLSGTSLVAIGKTRPQAAMNIATMTGSVLGCIAGYHLGQLSPNPHGPVAGFIIGFAAGKLTGLMTIQYSMHKAKIPVAMQDLRFSLALVGLTALGYLGPRVADMSVSGRRAQIAAQTAFALVLLAATGAVMAKVAIKALRRGRLPA
jgi:O-antigen/teichoic acid export membrane protein